MVTGICDGTEKLSTYGIDPTTASQFYYTVPRVEKNYPGTGDLFASVLIGEFLRTDNFSTSAEFASDFTSHVMRYTAKFDTPTRDGVALEAFLGDLTKRITINKETNDGRIEA